ncbi:MAG: hypothetical protein AUG51_09435 [Acidobacteria bacterium 13_1_20CM_3_53_8]|nr:MAG: hypothetical protein AUG51_09435 [Acidobacteria bacterium 13_1_20CM_3_53_8]
MLEDSTIVDARHEISDARALAGAERELTKDDRKQIVIHLSKALRYLKKIEREYVPKGGEQ